MQDLRRLMVGLGVAVTLVAGCGGGDDDTDSGASTDDAADATDSTAAARDEDTSEGASEETTDSEAVADTAPDGSDDGASIDGAVVMVGGEEFVLDQEIVCVAMGGAVGASFASSTADVSFDVDLPPVDWESRPDEEWGPPSVRLDDDRVDVPVSWRAGDEVVTAMNGVPPEVAVTSFSSDGNSGSGTAMVIDITTMGISEPVVTELTFEFSCD